MLAVIDTNVWISAFLTPEGYSAEVVRRFRADAFQPVFCPSTVYELRASLSKPRIAARINMTFRSMNEAVALLYASSPELPDPPIFPISRDPNDDIFIALAIASDADFLVTRDDDLKGDPAVREYLEAAGVRLVTVREFVEALGAAE